MPGQARLGASGTGGLRLCCCSFVLQLRYRRLGCRRTQSSRSSLKTVSARAMLAAMIAGEADSVRLAGLARGRMRRKIPELQQALTGHFDRVLLKGRGKTTEPSISTRDAAPTACRRSSRRSA